MTVVRSARAVLKTILDSLWDIAGSVSVRVKVLGIVLGVILLLGVFVILQTARILQSTLRDALMHQISAIAEDTQQDLQTFIQNEDAAGLQDAIDRRFAHYSNPSHNTEVAYIAALDSGGQIVSGAYADGFSAVQLPAALATASGAHLTPGDEAIEIIVPISDTAFTLRLGLSTEPINTFTRQVVFQLFEITLVMVAIGFAAAFFLTWVLTRPILDLVKATDRVAEGDVSYRVPRWANDEIGELSTAFNAMTSALEQAENERLEREQLREQYIIGVILAQENERQRIARELHDSVSQSLTSLLVGVQNLKQAKPGDDADQQAEGLRQIIARTLDETRNLSWQLRPSALGELGLATALERYVQDYQARYQIHVDLVIRGLPDLLPPEIETTIYRIIQEGLTNIARYAQATSASILLSDRGDVLRIIIEDNGAGFDIAAVTEKPTTLGLKGIRERAGLFGGTLAIESEIGKGTSLFVEIPYPRANSPGKDDD